MATVLMKVLSSKDADGSPIPALVLPCSCHDEKSSYGDMLQFYSLYGTIACESI